MKRKTLKEAPLLAFEWEWRGFSKEEAPGKGRWLDFSGLGFPFRRYDRGPGRGSALGSRPSPCGP
jgi:hypothetical protein